MNEIIVLGKRGTWYWSPKRWFYEKFISEYAQAMDQLREIDDAIGKWTDDLEFLYKQADLALRANRLADLFIVLFEIRNRLEKVVLFIPEVNKIESDIEAEVESKITMNSVKKDAGVADFLGKLIPEDWKKEYLLKKLKNKEKQNRIIELRKFINITKQIVLKVKQITSKLEENRSNGDIGVYAENLRAISQYQVRFVREFNNLINKDPYFIKVINYIEDKQEQEQLDQNIKELEKQKELDKDQKQLSKKVVNENKSIEQIPATVNDPNLNKPIEDKIKQLPTQTDIPDLVPTTVNEPSIKSEPKLIQPETLDKPYAENRPESTEKQPNTIKTEPLPMEESQLELPIYQDEEEIELSKMPTPIPPELPPSPTLRSKDIKKSHEQFLGKLMKESVYMDKYKLANLMLSYSAKIEEHDLESSLKLLAIAEGIIDG